jgi:prolyl-tRNA editing enzyme YbaK/EbsC (Cys-tRNA(Pro) deacylase)
MTSANLTPADLKAFIAGHNLRAELVQLSVPTPTVEAAAAAVGVGASQIVKSLLFWAGPNPVLVVASGTTTVDRRTLAVFFGVGRKQIKLMQAADVLAISGYPVGGVPPFGHLQEIKTLMDEEILLEEQVYAGGGAEHTLMRISPLEIQQVTQATLLELRAPAGDINSEGAG